MAPADYFRFLISDQVLKGSFFNEEEKFWEWFKRIESKSLYNVKQIPFAELKDWCFEETSGNLVHNSGKFFTVHGISIETDFPEFKSWSQPVISQPEIGLLGIITKSFDGIPHFLMQAKMEPGNINLVQLSPTIQATKSNYSRIHKGKLPQYFEYFMEKPQGRIIVDQLQSEQGARYIDKLNRNIIIEIEDDIEIHDNFCWLTLGQIKRLLQYDNIINMDARTVISNLQYLERNYKNFRKNYAVVQKQRRN